MINLRYHIVSLVAVFLALALGIVVGSTVLNEGTAQVQRVAGEFLRRTSQQTQAENDALRGQVGRYQEFGASTLPGLVGGKLGERPVVLLDTDRVDGAVRAKVEEALRAAGAAVSGRLTFSSERLALASPDDRGKLAELLGMPPENADALRDGLVERVTGRLTLPGKLPQDDGERVRDMITALSDAKFLTAADLPRPVREGGEDFPKAGSLFVIIGPTDGAATLAPSAFLVPLADQLSARSPAPVAGVESEVGVSSWVQELRGADEVAERISTVDDVDAVYGQVALVETLARQLANHPAGQYGFKQGASALLPEGLPAR